MSVSLKADCSNCAALCCVALAFDKSKLFAIDKDNGQACPNLGVSAKCTIHQDLSKKGFGGCIQYSCNGAGQRVVQEVFGGQSWQSDSSLLDPMLDAFAVMGRVHELILLLTTAQVLELSPSIRQTLQNYLQTLNPSNGWSAKTLHAFETQNHEAKIRKFLTTLACFVE